jgi:hypothetical protein
MKTLRRLCIVFVFTQLLALSAFAGDMSTSVVSQPPLPSGLQAATTGDMSTGFTGDISTSVTATNPVITLALDLLQSLLPLF